MLYLVATPIGNLADITYRAVEVLKNSDYILCEDTRHSRPLLQHYAIDRPLKSYHKFNESSSQETLIEDLNAGKHIALISDAGTPTLCDPGYVLVARCLQEGIKVTALPGACAAIVALTLSGFDPLPFQFVGFLPKKNSELKQALNQILIYDGTSIAYESPHRLEETLEVIKEIDPARTLCIARELTKLYEECKRGSAQELQTYFKTHPLKGECVLLFQRSTETIDWEHLNLKEHVELIYAQGNLSLNDAIKWVAQLRKLPKRTVYQAIHKASD